MLRGTDDGRAGLLLAEAVEGGGSEGDGVDAKALFRVQGLSVRDRGQQVVMPLVG